MAGGRRAFRAGPTLAERSAASAAPPAAVGTAAAGPGPARVRAVVTRHCWVAGLPGSEGSWAGLLVEWRQGGPDGRAGRGWEGRVVYVVVDAGASVLVEAWVAAQHLRPSG